MAELVLPGVYIDVRAEGLIRPQGVGVGNLGVIGTADPPKIQPDDPNEPPARTVKRGEPVILGSYADAKERFGDYDPWNDGEGGDLTLVRALELAYRFGATTVFAVWVDPDHGMTYDEGLIALLKEPAHIIVAAGQDESFGDELAAHCAAAASDDFRRERVAVVGSQLGISLDALREHTLSSDRLIFVAPGIKANDNAEKPPVEVTLPGAYAAAAVAGLMAGTPPHVSLTNKVLSVGGLEEDYSQAELKLLVKARVLALEKRLGFRIVKGITTATNTAWHQITTRRIVDYTKAGVRSAANPFIGRLNNSRVRDALRTSINSFLADMVTDEMLTGYELEVTATRDQEIKGIVQVTMVLRPVFSIDFIKVIMNLE